LRLRRLTIRKYRDLAGPVDLEFGRGHVFLLGKNGTGKSTLLELIWFLITFNLELLRDDEVGVDIEWTIETSGPREGRNAATVTARFEAEALSRREAHDREDIIYNIIDEIFTNKWIFSLRCSINEEIDIPVDNNHNYNSSTDLNHKHDSPRPADQLQMRWRFDEPPSVRIGDHDLSSKFGEARSVISENSIQFIYRYMMKLLSQSSLEANGLIAPFMFEIEKITNFHMQHIYDESLEVHQRIVDRSGYTKTPNDPKYIQNDRSDFLPTHLLSSLLRPVDKPQPQPAEPYPLHPWLLPLLNAKTVDAHPRLYQRDAKGQSTYQGFDIYVTWPDGSLHHHSQLSFGQKRLIAFAWYADVAPEAPLLTDELTNGMHAAWVRRIVDILGDRQAIHALQNPLLLDAVGPGEPDEVRARFILCDVADNPRLWTWRNPTEAEAARIHAAWSTGFQHLSEILESEGLW
jgi:energy-coupling factor transporter ATP-binding protein EcfA2